MVMSQAVRDVLDALFEPDVATVTDLVDLIRRGGRGGHIVVAAVDASPLTIAQSDYTADGTADDVQLQAALDGLPT